MMKALVEGRWLSLACLALFPLAPCASGQGGFVDLDFQEPLVALVAGPQVVAVSNALPGWTVYYGGVPQPTVDNHSIYSGIPPGVSIWYEPFDPYDFYGNYSVALNGTGITGGPSVAIGQYGTIPADAQSLTFIALDAPSVSFGGAPVPVSILGPGPKAAWLWGGDISAYAGQYGELLFTAGYGGAYPLDDITFSPQEVPEPGASVLALLGGLLTVLARRRNA